MSTSRRYDELRKELVAQYVAGDVGAGSEHWLKHYAPKWRNRVGIPRLAAEAAIIEAIGLLGSIHPATFRSDPDLLNKLLDARDAVSELSEALGVDNWERFEGKK